MEDSKKCLQLDPEQISDKELATGLKLACEENPMHLIEQEFLHIKTKDAGLIPLVLNEPQVSFSAIIKKKREENKPIRILLLKSRQEGMSTYIEALIYAFTSQRENINSLIMADIKDHANNLFEMSKLYQEMLEKEHAFLAPRLKKSNEKKLEFAGIHSQIIIATAENLEAAKSHTFQLVHLSESSHYRDLKTLMSDLNQTVPELPGTMIILETTANGKEHFYDLWIDAIQDKNDWMPVFIPWFALAEYSRPLVEGKLYHIKGIKFDADESEYTFNKEEKEIKEQFKLTEEQLNWRRYTIVNKCDGVMATFNEQYPDSWRKAFQASGANFFNTKALDKQIAQRPKVIGDVFKEEMKHIFRTMPQGKVKIYDYPVSYEQYIITIDASEALGSDEGNILVINKRLNRTVAVVNGQYPPEVLADVASKLGYFYNGALIAPESKGYGYMVIQHLSQTYGNIYKRVKTKSGTKETTTELGFNTNLLTRPEMLGRLAEEVLNNSIELLDEDLIDQCGTFIINPVNKKEEAETGKEDGLVICRAIASQVRHENPYRPPRDKAKDREAYNRIKAQPAVGSKF